MADAATQHLKRSEPSYLLLILTTSLSCSQYEDTIIICCKLQWVLFEASCLYLSVCVVIKHQL